MVLDTEQAAIVLQRVLQQALQTGGLGECNPWTAYLNFGSSV